MAKENKKRGGWQKALDILNPSRVHVTEFESRNVDIPSSSVGFLDAFGVGADPVQNVFSAISSEETVLHELPIDRLAKYPFLEAMSVDPTIDCALQMHVANALSATEEDGEVLFIESTGDANDAIVNDLRDTFKEVLNTNIHKWAYTVAQLGLNYIRVYGEPGIGITRVRHDHYTHPRFVREFEKGGQLAGFTNAYQDAGKGLRLMEPWTFVPFRIPFSRREDKNEPVRIAATEMDLAQEDFNGETLVETQDYGASLVETAYGPWIDLMEAILSMNMSRKNAARLDRLLGVNTGQLDPTKSAQYLAYISKVLTKAKEERERASLRRGTVQTVNNMLIPIMGDTKGRLDISTVEGDANIDGLEDIKFHINRLGSAVGIDPSLLGFGEQLSGGLGDGGFFRLSILAGQKAQLLRKAMKSGVERLFDLHIAWKYGKTFLPGQKPWRILFNSVSSSLEREARENLEARTNISVALASLPMTFDPEMTTVDKRAFANYLMTDVIGMEEEKFKEIFPEGLAKKAEEAAAAEPEGGSEQDIGNGVFESAAGNEALKEMVFQFMEEYYRG